jgi:hypothetical protein
VDAVHLRVTSIVFMDHAVKDITMLLQSALATQYISIAGSQLAGTSQQLDN